MSITVQPATVGYWVDASTPLTHAVVAALKTAGKVGVVRYVPLPRNGTGWDISAGELATICGGGLALGLVQHVRTGPGGLWVPSAHSSAEDASTAAEWASLVGYPEGAHVWLDLEAVNDTRIATIAYCVGWQKTMIEAGYRAGMYHGYSVPLSGQDLFDLPGFNSYWTDAGNRSIPTRGNAIVQAREAVIAGVKFDLDTVAADLFGELPLVAGMAADDAA